MLLTWKEAERECQIARINASNSKDVITSEEQLFQFRNVVIATNIFDEANKLGQGGFRSVYMVGTIHQFNYVSLRLVVSAVSTIWLDLPKKKKLLLCETLLIQNFRGNYMGKMLLWKDCLKAPDKA